MEIKKAGPGLLTEGHAASRGRVKQDECIPATLPSGNDKQGILRASREEKIKVEVPSGAIPGEPRVPAPSAECPSTRE